MATNTANYQFRKADANDNVIVQTDLADNWDDVDTELFRVDSIAKPLSVESVAYTPVWSATTGAAPAKGNGVLVGRYVKTGRWVEVWIYQKMGSTTTYGDADNNQWRWSLPFAAANFNAYVGTNSENLWIGNAFAFDPGVANRIGSCVVKSNDSLVRAVSDNSTDGWARNLPHTWGTDDTLTLHFRYEAAA